MPTEKIAVLAGDYKQFKDWLQNNVIPVINKRDLDRLKYIEISKIFTKGNYDEWFDSECKDTLKAITNRLI